MRLRTGLVLTLGALAAAACGGEDEGRGPLADREQSATLGGSAGEALRVTRVAPEEIRIGERIAYTLRVENTADEALDGVVVRERPPGEFEVIEGLVRYLDADGEAQERDSQAGSREGASPRDAGRPVEAGAPTRGSQGVAGSQQGWQQDSQQGSQMGSKEQGSRELRFELGRLGAGQVAEVQIVGVAHAEGEVQACALVSYDAPVCAEWTLVDPQMRADLVLERDSVSTCEELPVKLHLENVGSGTISPGRFVLTLPEGLRTEDGERRYEYEVDALSAGDSFEEEIVLKPERSGTYRLRGMVSTDGIEVATRSRTVTVEDPQVELQVGALGDVPLGRVARAPVTVHNTGRVLVRDLVLHVEGSENVAEARLVDPRSDDEESGTEHEFDELAPGESRELVLLLLPEAAGTMSAQVRASAQCLEDRERMPARTLSAQAYGVAAVRLELFDETDPVSVGETTTYHVRVRNQGTTEDLDVALVMSLPQQLEFVSADGPSDVRAGEGGEVRFAPLERLDASSEAAWTIELRAVAVGETVVALELRSQATPGPVREEEATRVIQ